MKREKGDVRWSAGRGRGGARGSGGGGDQEVHVVGLFDESVREGGEEELLLLGEEGGARVGAVDQEDRVAAEVGQVRVDGDPAAPADLAASEVELAGGVGQGGSGAAAVQFDDGMVAEAALDAVGLLGVPGDVDRGGVPPEGQRAAGAQYAEGLRRRVGWVGPVPGLGVGDEVGGGGGQGRASPLPRTIGMSGWLRRNWAAMPSPGSTARTSAPRRRRRAVAMPVPAPTSTTRAPVRGRSASSSIASKRAGG